MKKLLAILGLLSCTQSWGAELSGSDHPLFKKVYYQQPEMFTFSDPKKWENWSGSGENLKALIFGGHIKWYRRQNITVEVEAPSLEQLHQYLHEPITTQHPVMLEALMVSNRGVNINSFGPDGLTILQREARKLCAAINTPPCIPIILEYGGDPYLVNAQGESAESIADQYGYTFNIEKSLRRNFIGNVNILDLFDQILNDPILLANLAQFTEPSFEIKFFIKQLQENPELLNNLNKNIPNTLKAKALLKSLEGLAFNYYMTPWNMPGTSYQRSTNINQPVNPSHHSAQRPTSVPATPAIASAAPVTLSSLDKALFNAVRDNEKTLQSFIEQNKSSLTSDMLEKALELACFLGKEKHIQLLLEAGAPISDEARKKAKNYDINLAKFTGSPHHSAQRPTPVPATPAIASAAPVMSQEEIERIIQSVHWPSNLPSQRPTPVPATPAIASADPVMSQEEIARIIKVEEVD